MESIVSHVFSIRSALEFDTDLKKRRLVGIISATVLLGLFLAFNRIPKLDTVEADLAIVTSPVAQCFQGFCLENTDNSTFWERWWNFSLTYLNLVWIGMVFAFIMAGITESFLFPKNSSQRFTGQGFSGVLKGAVIGPVMSLCSACIVPIATAFRRRGAGIESTVAITQGSSTMNLPALIMASMVFIPLIGGSRIVLSVIGTLVLGSVVAKVIGGKQALASSTNTVTPPILPDESSWKDTLTSASFELIQSTIRQAFRLGPIMVVAGFVSGLAIQWISPQTVTTWIGDDVLGILVAATLGIAVNVPLMFEIPLVAAMLLAGMGTAPAASLLFTAAAAGPITYWGLAKVFPLRGVIALGVSTWVLGVIGGIVLLAITAMIEDQREFSFRADYSKTSSTSQITLPIGNIEVILPGIWGSPVPEDYRYHQGANQYGVSGETSESRISEE